MCPSPIRSIRFFPNSVRETSRDQTVETKQEVTRRRVPEPATQGKSKNRAQGSSRRCAAVQQLYTGRSVARGAGEVYPECGTERYPGGYCAGCRVPPGLYTHPSTAIASCHSSCQSPSSTLAIRECLGSRVALLPLLPVGCSGGRLGAPLLPGHLPGHQPLSQTCH